MLNGRRQVRCVPELTRPGLLSAPRRQTRQRGPSSAEAPSSLPKPERRGAANEVSFDAREVILVRHNMLRIVLAGAACVSIASISAAVTADAYGAQKGDRMQTKEVRSYHTPRRNGNRIPFCLAAAGTCGKLAADAFCRANQFEAALTFQRDSTRDSHSAQIRFLNIKCWRSKSAIAAKKTPAPDEEGAGVVSNTVAKSHRR